jgi:hypothetical protein
MTDTLQVPFAHYSVKPGATPLHLHGGPLDGWDVGVEGPAPPAVRVNGPRHGNHTIWVTHTYVLRDGAYQYATTEQDDIGTIYARGGVSALAALPPPRSRRAR